MIADLVHHVREDLSITTLAHVVHIYSCNLHDATLAPSIQTMCSKLLLNLTENVVKTETEDATHILYRSLETFVRKIENLAESRDDWKKWSRPAGMTAKQMREKAGEAEGKLAVTDSKTKEKKKTEQESKDSAATMDVEETQEKVSAAHAQDVEMQAIEEAEKSAEEFKGKEEKELDVIDEVDVERAKPIAQNSAMTDTTTDLLRGKALRGL